MGVNRYMAPAFDSIGCVVSWVRLAVVMFGRDGNGRLGIMHGLTVPLGGSISMGFTDQMAARFLCLGHHAAALTAACMASSAI